MTHAQALAAVRYSQRTTDYSRELLHTCAQLHYVALFTRGLRIRLEASINV